MCWIWEGSQRKKTVIVHSQATDKQTSTPQLLLWAFLTYQTCLLLETRRLRSQKLRFHSGKLHLNALALLKLLDTSETSDAWTNSCSSNISKSEKEAITYATLLMLFCLLETQNPFPKLQVIVSPKLLSFSRTYYTILFFAHYAKPPAVVSLAWNFTWVHFLTSSWALATSHRFFQFHCTSVFRFFLNCSIKKKNKFKTSKTNGKQSSFLPYHPCLPKARNTISSTVRCPQYSMNFSGAVERSNLNRFLHKENTFQVFGRKTPSEKHLGPSCKPWVSRTL